MNSSQAARHAVTREMPDPSVDDNRPGMVTGLFPDRSSAERAYGAITSRGYDKGDINLVMSDKTRKEHFADTGNVSTDLGSKAAEGAGVGSAIGGTLGAIVAAVAAVGTSIAIPGLGLVIAGPIVAALAGAGAGGVTGGLVGALVGWNMPEDRVKLYQDGIDQGGILMGITPRSTADADFFEREWKAGQGRNVFR